MKKFFVLFLLPARAIDEWQRVTSPEDMKRQSEDLRGKWNAWLDAHSSSFLDRGGPLGKTKKVDHNGVSDIRNDLNWYAIVQAESHQAAAELFVGHPQLTTITSAHVEVMEIPEVTM